MKSDRTLKDNYKKINQLSARCMKALIALMILGFIYSFFVSDIDKALLVILFSISIIVALIPILLINILKWDESNFTKHIVVICICIDMTIMLTMFSSYIFPIMLFPILMASLYYNQTFVLFTSLLVSMSILISDFLSVKYNAYFVGNPYDSYDDSLIHYAVLHIVVVFILSIAAYFIVQRNSMMINSAISDAATMQNNQKGLIYAFSEISESKSKNTGEHIKRVAEYMRIMGRASGFDEEYVDMLSTASMMHDIGKLMIDEEILDKPEKLTNEEYQIMKNHVLYGEALLEKCPGEIMHIACILAKEHHERWDGSGYLGMKGEEIAYISRLIAVCDVFDALTSERYYKKGWSLEETFNEIVSLSGKHFDPAVVKLFIQNFDEFKEVHNRIQDKQIY
ncbi:MAG: HD-GYP domain-containing protein [Lachnospiraceae bacterium]|nr:HD-GYP domain-containing protein [Lachnospiraceae bacterium]